MISAFIHFIRKLINPLHLQIQDIYRSNSSDIPRSNSNVSLSLDKCAVIDNDKTVRIDDIEKKTIYVGIENTDLPQRVQHNICNLIGLDKEELAYIAELDCKHMFEVVKLLNRSIISLVDGI
jgi:hypothetical protein